MSPFPGAVVGDGGRLFSLWSPSLLSEKTSRTRAGLVRNGRPNYENGVGRNLRERKCSSIPMVGIRFSRGRNPEGLKLRSRAVAMAASTSSAGNNWVDEPLQQNGAKEIQLQFARLVRWANQKLELSPELVALAFVAFVLGELWIYGFTVLRFVILGVSLVYFTRTVSSSGLFHGDFRKSFREKVGKQLQDFAEFWRAGTSSIISSPASTAGMEEISQPVQKTVVNIKLKGKRDSESASQQIPEDRDSDSKDSAVDGGDDGDREENGNSPRLIRLANTISSAVNAAGVNSLDKVGAEIQSRDPSREDFVRGVERDQSDGADDNARLWGVSVEEEDIYRSEIVMQAEQKNSSVVQRETHSEHERWNVGDSRQAQAYDRNLGPGFISVGAPDDLGTGEPVDDGLGFSYSATGSTEAHVENLSTESSSIANAEDGLQVGKGPSSPNPRQIDDDWVEIREEGWTYNYYDEVVHNAAPVIGESAKSIADESKEWVDNGGGFQSSGAGDSWGKIVGGFAGTSEQRGSLTKSRAMGRGSNFSPVDDDWDEDRAKGGERRMPLDDERGLYRNYGSGSSGGGQPLEGKEQSVPYGRAGRGSDRQTWSDVEEPSVGASSVYGGGPFNARRSQQPNDGAEGVAKQGRGLNQDLGKDNKSMRRDASTSAMDSSGADEDVSSRDTRMRYSASRDFSSMAQDVRRGGDLEEMNEGGNVNRGRRSTDEGTPRGVNRSEDGSPTQGRREYWREDADPQMGSRGDPSPTSARGFEAEQNLAIERLKQADSVQIERYLDEAEALLEEGMQGLEGRIEVGVAESMLYEAAKLFERASDMDPTDLTGVGQWGNTLLVHGELKLKVSQQIRGMLPARKPSGLPFRGGGRDNADREREEMEVALQQVCEECEDLLVEAGRKYRRALSLDRTDVRALYNWGLALCYRGQLISEEGGELKTLAVAFGGPPANTEPKRLRSVCMQFDQTVVTVQTAIQDADKVYLAATDKFEAMLGISQDYAAGALLNWGLALRDRSRLRPMGDKERVQILLQAKELFQDALRLDPNYGQARGAVAACLTELRELQSLEVEQKRDRKDGPSNWWRRGG